MNESRIDTSDSQAIKCMHLIYPIGSIAIQLYAFALTYFLVLLNHMPCLRISTFASVASTSLFVRGR